VSETVFKDAKEAESQSTEKVNFATGYGLKNGVHVSGVGKIQTPAEATKSLYDKVDTLKERFK
jgi:hypothetical protein